GECANRERHRVPSLPRRPPHAPAGTLRTKDLLMMATRMRALAAAAILLAIAIPFVGSDYLIGLLFTTFLFVGMAYGWNLISGYTAYVSFGQISFFGIGAYAVAILVSKLSWAWPFAVLAGAGAAALIAAPLG